jgi:hypothetical protein
MIMRPVLFLLFCPVVCSAQVYTARTDLEAQPYPAPIPCPSSSCSAGGAPTGANTIITPSDFNLPITRVTDRNTEGTSGRNDSFYVDSSAEVNFMNINDDRFIVQDNGGGGVPFIWNGSTRQATRMYIPGNSSTNGWRMTGISGLPFWSFTQPYIAYDIEIASNKDPTLYYYDLSSTTTRPNRVALADLANCASALSGVGYTDYAAPDVSDDDQTFGTYLSTTSGQGSAGDVYVIVWNRTNGCRVWNTGTGMITGAWGTTGTVGITDRFTIHNARISRDGNWMRVDIQVCNSGACLSPNDDSEIYVWQIDTLTVSVQGASAGIKTAYGNHYANGYTHQVNDPAAGGGYTGRQIVSRSFSNLSSVTSLASPLPSGSNGFFGHLSWANDNSSDTNPVFLTSFTGSFTPVQAWDNEVLAYASNGSGTVWRFAHTYATNDDSYDFSAGQAIGAVSQDGKWYAWTTDWNGMLGDTSGTSNSCTIGINCRADVFMLQLPIEMTASSPAPPTSLTATVN